MFISEKTRRRARIRKIALELRNLVAQEIQSESGVVREDPFLVLLQSSVDVTVGWIEGHHELLELQTLLQLHEPGGGGFEELRRKL